MPNKHHHEGTGRFKSTADVKGFNARTIAPTPTPLAPVPMSTPKAAPTPPKR